MDTRKLEVLKCASIDIGNGDGFQEVPELIFPDDKRGGADFHTLGYAFSYEDAAELVTRWNAYPDLIAQAPTLKAENERLRAALEQMTNALEVASTSPQSGPFKMDLQGSREVFAAIAKTGRATLTK